MSKMIRFRNSKVLFLLFLTANSLFIVLLTRRYRSQSDPLNCCPQSENTHASSSSLYQKAHNQEKVLKSHKGDHGQEEVVKSPEGDRVQAEIVKSHERNRVQEEVVKSPEGDRVQAEIVKSHERNRVQEEVVKSREETIRSPIIFEATGYFAKTTDVDFETCKYSNCKLIDGSDKGRANFEEQASETPDIYKASIVLFTRSLSDWFNESYIPKLPWEIRSKQLWILRNHESPMTYSIPEYYEGIFNLTMTYRLDSDIPNSWIPIMKRKKDSPNPHPPINYKQNKTKGALALITQCRSSNYNRLEAAEKLREYIDVDIHGKCGSSDICKRKDWECEGRTHQKYHFFLAFENSLCEDFVTEKFWVRMASKANFLPVAIGDTSMKVYNTLAPPNSFIHLYNFTSIDALGKYLKLLMENEDLYNSYHTWRESYFYDIEERTLTNENPNKPCELCRVANEMPRKPAINNMREWFSWGHCRNLEFLLKKEPPQN